MGDSDRRHGVFREKGGVGYPENEMPELRRNSKDVLKAGGEIV